MDEEQVACWRCGEMTNVSDADYRGGQCYDCWWENMDPYDKADWLAYDPFN